MQPTSREACYAPGKSSRQHVHRVQSISAMFPSSKATLDFQDKARGFTPMGTSKMPSSSEAAVRCNKKYAPLDHRQVMKSYPRGNNHALLGSLTGNQSFTLPFLTSKKLPLRHWQIKRLCPVLHLPRNGASKTKQTDLSVRLKGRHRRGSAPMFIILLSRY